MAEIEKLIPLIFKWEGGYVNDPDDRGGATNMGVTLRTWREAGYDKNGDGYIDVNDLKLLTREEVVERVLRPHYWNRWQADRIHNQSIANLLVDWLWHSGAAGIKQPQDILCVKVDGIVGEKTLAAVNGYYSQRVLFDELKAERECMLLTLCRTNPRFRRFRAGWMNRLKAFTFRATPLLLFAGMTVSCRTAAGTQTIRQETVSEGKSTTDSTLYERQMAVTELSQVREQDGEEMVCAETLIVRYDTSLVPDPETKEHPVSERVRTIVTKTARVRQKEQTLRRDTAETGQRLEYRSESNSIRMDKEIRRVRGFPFGKVLIAGAGLCWLFVLWRGSRP